MLYMKEKTKHILLSITKRGISCFRDFHNKNIGYFVARVE